LTRRTSDSAVSTVVLLFFGSGCAALIYEIVWFQLLQLVIGSSAISLALLLGTFMGGMCLGSLLVPRIADRHRDPMRLFATFELAIGAMGLLILVGMPLINSIYGGLGGQIAVRIAIACICLLPPTIAMGATLPVVARWLGTSPAGVAGLGLFYGSNLAGGVTGTLLAGFYLLRVFDVAIATYVAAAVNLAVAVGASTLAGSGCSAAGETRAGDVRGAENSGLVYTAIALSGMTALSAEVVWTRLLSLNFGATVYALSLILAAFLVGLSGGSAIGAMIGPRFGIRPRAALGYCQLLLCASIAWAAFLLTRAYPYWAVSEAVKTHPWLTFRLDLFRALIAVVPGAALWGVSFTLALASVTNPDHDLEQDPGRLTGGVYAANTLGAIVGALGTSVALGARLGSQHVQQALIGIAAGSGLIALMSSLPSSQGVRPWQWISAAMAVVMFVPSVSPVPDALIAYGRQSAEWIETSKYADMGQFLFAGEGMSEFVAVSRGAGGELNFHAAGKIQASTLAEDMRLQLLLAHLSHLVPRHSANVLVIGCGAGITAGALSTGPEVKHITIADIEPLVPEVADKYFGEYNNQVLRNPNVSVVIDDGRHVLTASNETFDIITTDLIDPWVKGVAALFTREFYELAKRHLRPGGVVTQFVQLYQSNPEAVKSEIATFVEAFPNTVIWGNPNNGQGYDLVLLGQTSPVRIDVDDLQTRLASPRYAAVAQSLQRIGIGSAVELLSKFAGTGADLEPWLRNAAINRDRSLRLQYLAGLGLNLSENGAIYRDMLRYAKFRPELFVGSPAALQQLRTAFEHSVNQ
jgi:spermidine synthase